MVLWNSALSMLSKSARSENDNAEVGRVYDRLREIIRDGPVGLLIDHTARVSGALVSRGATPTFNALDLSYGVRLQDADMPSRDAAWHSIVSVEKDRLGHLGGRSDREVTFYPLGNGKLAIDVHEVDLATNRHTQTADPVRLVAEQIAKLQPPPRSAVDVEKLLKVRRQTAQAAMRMFRNSGAEAGGTGVPVFPSVRTEHVGTPRRPVQVFAEQPEQPEPFLVPQQ
jgi:hypothetical protein